MSRPPIRFRTFILGTILVVLLVPTLAAGAAWAIERENQSANIQHRVNLAISFLTIHRHDIRDPATLRRFERTLAPLDLRALLVFATESPPAKDVIFVSSSLESPKTQRAAKEKAATALVPSTSWGQERHRIEVSAKPTAILSTTLYYRHSSSAARALVAFITWVVIFFAGLIAAIWLAGRWMVSPLARLSAEVDKVAGGDLSITVPRSRIGEITNIAQAVDGMTAALSEAEQRRDEADEARRFLVTSVAHDLRTPLFALRGHLQAIRSRLGDPAVHLERAEARADALERLIGNFFAFTRDDYAQPTLQLETVALAELLEEITAGLAHSTHLGENEFAYEGDRAINVIVDRDRVKRALTNVLENALRFSPARAPVHLKWIALDEACAQVTIQDHGPGINDELLPHVFEPGIRGNPDTSGADGGAGLGLTIAKRLLEHQHATISVDNHPSGGALVTVTLRRAPLDS
jgi:signal transduction histidine kinase